MLVDCTSKPCEQLCQQLSGGYKCSCNEGFAVNPGDTTKCQKIEVCRGKADIVLLFDSSSSVGESNYQKQFDFAKRLSRHFELGPDDFRFGGIIFSRSVEKLFDLKDHNDHSSLDKALEDVKYMSSSTYTHSAFRFLQYDDTFSTGKGGRDDARDIVILLTDGNSNRRSKTLRQARHLKAAGIGILAVGIGPDINMDELYQVASSREDVFHAQSFDLLDDIEPYLAHRTCGDYKGCR